MEAVQVWQRPIIQYIEEPSISALRVKAEKEEEMKTLDDYWKERLQKQEVSYSVTDGSLLTVLLSGNVHCELQTNRRRNP